MKPKKCVCGEKLIVGTHQDNNHQTLCKKCSKRHTYLWNKLKLKTAKKEDFEELRKLQRIGGITK